MPTLLPPLPDAPAVQPACWPISPTTAPAARAQLRMQTVSLVAARRRSALYKRRLRARRPRQGLLELKAGPFSRLRQWGAHIRLQQHQQKQQQQLMEWQQPMGWHSQRQGERL